MILGFKTHALVVVFGCKIRRIAVKKADGAIVLPYQLFKILVFNYYLLQSSCRQVYHREIRPNRMRLTCKAVKSTCVAVSNKLIKLRRPVNITKSAEQTSLVKTSNPVEIFTRIEDITKLVFQLIRFISYTAVQVCKVSVKIVVHLKIHTGRFAKKHPACAPENLDIPFIIWRKASKHGVTQRFLSAYP